MELKLAYKIVPVALNNITKNQLRRVKIHKRNPTSQEKTGVLKIMARTLVNQICDIFSLG
jgi:hypothetical protein